MSNYHGMTMMLPVGSLVYQRLYHLSAIPLPGDVVEIIPRDAGKNNGVYLSVKYRLWKCAGDVEIWFNSWYPSDKEEQAQLESRWEKVNG